MTKSRLSLCFNDVKKGDVLNLVDIAVPPMGGVRAMIAYEVKVIAASPKLRGMEFAAGGRLSISASSVGPFAEVSPYFQQTLVPASLDVEFYWSSSMEERSPAFGNILRIFVQPYSEADVLDVIFSGAVEQLPYTNEKPWYARNPLWERKKSKPGMALVKPRRLISLED